MSDQHTGTIKKWFEGKGYGFIRPDSGGDDDFLHISNIGDDVDEHELEGSRVRYRMGPGRKGPEAKQAEIIETSGEQSARRPVTETPYRVPRDTAPLLDKRREEAKNLSVYLHTAAPFEKDQGTYEPPKIDGSFSFDRFSQNALRRVQEDYVKLVTEQADIATRRLDVAVDWRLAVGLGRSTVYETGLTIHPIYGVPYVPGSGVKGALRTFLINTLYRSDEMDDGEAEKVALQDPGFCDLFGAPEATAQQPTAYDDAQRGHVIFYDAFPASRPTVKADIMNSHFGDYYGGSAPPTDDMDPNPVTFLTVTDAAFTFLIGTPQRSTLSDGPLRTATPEDRRKSLLAVADYWLRRLLTEHGVGAKTAVGYGYFAPKTDASN